MPFLGVNAIEQMGVLLDAIRTDLVPTLHRRTTRMPVVPPEARCATININAIHGGQAGLAPQTPCVADCCEAIFDRRFLIEESFESTRDEIVTLLEKVFRGNPLRRYELTDILTVHPVETPRGSPLTAALASAIEEVLGRKPVLVASPGTYDHKHVRRIAGIEHCVAYGPGVLEVAHQADEYCSVDDLISATKVLALAICDLAGTV